MSEQVSSIEKYAPSDSGSSEPSDILDLKDDEGWEDAEPEDEEQNQFVSLFDDVVFPDILAMLDYCKEKHGFDFLEVRQKLGLDFYGSIKLTNYIRSKAQSKEKVTSDISLADLEDEKYLKPVLEDDALLFCLDELPDVNQQNGSEGKGKEAEPGQLVARVSELEEELRKIQTQFENYRNTVKETLDERWNDQSAGPSVPEKEEKRDDDSHYFSSYSYNGQISATLFHVLSNDV
ncbi:Ribosomal protein arginine N-methyltransferase rmt3 [Clarireedia jacksonii]